eukprot:TRINITY_DN25080_c0_g1_i1.p1 TRINITY_DN25080_c0_g1~~TRINITY_DN25080_c0_g1_i1.p1  ORF type:complete len:282 (+),score=108.90 TRINITY_DN25080_c0_g1_i1:72-848(+)
MKLAANCGLGAYTLFTKQGLERLDKRTVELIDEGAAERERFKELHRERVRLEKARSEKLAAKEAGVQRCTELQMLKFGQLIDLEVLDRVGATLDEEEVNKKLAQMESQHREELSQLSATAARLKASMLRCTGENTALLTRVAHLTSRKLQLEKELNVGAGKGASLGTLTHSGPGSNVEEDERERLKSLVRLQAKELDAMKAEINLLRRKGGHAYFPPLPPLAPQQVDLGLHGVQLLGLQAHEGLEPLALVLLNVAAWS